MCSPGSNHVHLHRRSCGTALIARRPLLDPSHSSHRAAAPMPRAIVRHHHWACDLLRWRLGRMPCICGNVSLCSASHLALDAVVVATRTTNARRAHPPMPARTPRRKMRRRTMRAAANRAPIRQGRCVRPAYRLWGRPALRARTQRATQVFSMHAPARSRRAWVAPRRRTRRRAHGDARSILFKL
jgi:hypothetical protein